MFGPDMVFECPVCRCRLQVPPRRGQVAYTCRNGHRFLHQHDTGNGSWPARHPRLTVMVVALVLLLLFAMHQWAGHMFFPLRTT